MSTTIVLERGGLVESRHRVHCAVVDPEGRLVASVGDPELVTHFRSAAKPIQALPLVEDGVVEAIGIPPEELALACGSHSGEEAHVNGVRRLLKRAGLSEGTLELGPHLPMRESEAHVLLRSGGEALPVHNNCSGKHAGMLALAHHHGWPLDGYRLPDHPVQRRMAREVAKWTGVEPDAIRSGVDGCGVVCFGVPLRAMARGYAALGAAAARGEAGPAAVIGAMTAHPFYVAGTGRLCTELMEATRGAVFAKVGAEGVYCAGDREGTLGIALKVEDGSRRAVEVALISVLELLDLLDEDAGSRLEPYRSRSVPNTLGEGVAALRAELELVPSGFRPTAGAEEGEGGLEPGVRSLVRLSGALSTRNRDAIREALDLAGRAAAGAEVEEVLIQAYLFLGFPAALNALALWRNQGASGPDPEVDLAGDPERWEARGEEVCARVYGDRYEDLRKNIRALHPDLDRWMIREGYGKVLGRPGLTLPVRELCIVGLLAVLDAPVQLYSHLRGALAVGATADEVEGALHAVEGYMGFGVRRRAREQWDRVRNRNAGETMRNGEACS